MVAVALLFGFVSASMAAEGTYISGNLGLAMPISVDGSGSGIDMEFEFDNGYSVGGAVGYDFGTVRLEGEIAYQKTAFDNVKATYSGDSVTLNMDGDISVVSFLINGYFDIKNDSAFTPFIGAGAGYADITANDVTIAGENLGSVASDGGLAYQLSLGVSYAVNEKTAIEVKYRYFVPDEDFKSHNVLFGVRLSF